MNDDSNDTSGTEGTIYETPDSAAPVVGDLQGNGTKASPAPAAPRLGAESGDDLIAAAIAAMTAEESPPAAPPPAAAPEAPPATSPAPETPKQTETELNLPPHIAAALERAAQTEANTRALLERLEQERQQPKQAMPKTPYEALQVLASAMGIQDPMKAYEALSYGIATGKTKPPSQEELAAARYQQLEQEFRSFKEQQLREKETAVEREVHDGIIDMITPSDYPLATALGRERAGGHVFHEVKASFSSGQPVRAVDRLTQLEQAVEKDFFAVAAVMDDARLAKAGLARLKPNGTPPHAASGTQQTSPAMAPSTITNAAQSGHVPESEDADYWRDPDKLLAAAVRAASRS